MSIYDPPADPYGNAPTHGECSVCREVNDYGDMTTCGRGWKVEICDSCINTAVSKFQPGQRAEVESIIKSWGVISPEEIKEYLEESEN